METSEKLVYCIRDRAIGIAEAVNNLPGMTAHGLADGEIIDSVIRPVSVERAHNRWYAFVWVRVRRDD